MPGIMLRVIHTSHLTLMPAPGGLDYQPWFQDELQNLLRSRIKVRTGFAATASRNTHADYSGQDPAVHNTPIHLSCVCSQEP